MSGNGNHDAKYAGLTHGSHRMLPAGVSIRMLAWPVPVIRTEDIPRRYNSPVRGVATGEPRRSCHTDGMHAWLSTQRGKEPTWRATNR